MKVNFKQIVYSLGLIVAILLSSNVYSQSTGASSADHEAMREKKKAQMLEIFKQLDLSPEQEGKLNAHRNKYREQRKEVRRSIKAKREEMKAELQKQDLDMERINKIHSEMKSMKSKKADNRLRGILEVRKILTTEQFVRFMKLKKDLHSLKRSR